MTEDAFTLSCSALPGAVLVGFRGTERLNRPFELELYFTLPVGADLATVVGAPATLGFDRGDREPMAWHGVFGRVRILHQSFERALCLGLLVPRLWRLRHSVRSHVHTKAKLDAFVGKTLEHGGLGSGDYRFQIDAGAYPEEELVCQYRESHLDFVHRWLEREGAYYFFEHAPADGGSEIMVVVDDKGQHQPLPGSRPVAFAARLGDDASAGEGFRELRAERRVLPARVALADYNYASPAAPVTAEVPAAADGVGLVREYGYRVFEGGEIERLAGIKAASVGCQRLVVRARGNVSHLRPGYVFELEAAPGDGLPTRYLAVEVRHAGSLAGATAEVRQLTGLSGAETYLSEVVAIPADVQYRAPQVTPWPRVYGFENGKVDGPASSPYAQIDAMGRYLVRFAFDASDLADGKASTYVRMAQPHGGTLEGHHFPLRKGTEVMLGFQAGDPDRAYIAGVVPTAVRKSPVTAANSTLNILRSGGGNYLIIEDLEGHQFMWFYSPTSKTTLGLGGPFTGKFHGFKMSGPQEVPCTFYVKTAGNAGFSIGGGEWQDIAKTMKVHVKGSTKLEYDANATLTVGAKEDESVGGMRLEKTTGTSTLTHQGYHSLYSGSLQLRMVSGDHTLARHAGVVDTISGSHIQAVLGPVKQDFGGQTTTTGITAHIGTGKITLHGASAAHLEAPVILTFAFAKFFDVAPTKKDFYGKKVGIGIGKVDVAGASGTATGLKVDFAVSSSSAATTKREAVGLKGDCTGAKFKLSAATSETVALDGKAAGVAAKSGPQRVN
ncbi:MAG: type VI secretion system tip protein VgrG [Myxococcales bacterium]|nr:type VI secretion system tip protein VgrG [Myxococcales bacterium]